METYQKECLRLRYIAETTVAIVLDAGLGDKLKKNKRLRNFTKTINWSQFEMQNVMTDISSIKELRTNLQV